MENFSFKGWVAGFLFVSLLWASPGMAQQKEPLRIGMETTLSGPYAQPGTDNLNGAILYLEQKGYTIAGRKVEFYPEDEEANPNVALTKAKRLVELRKIHIFAGPFMANDAYAVAPYFDSKKVPMIVDSTPDDLTQRKRSKWVIRSAQTSSQAAHVMADYAYRVLGYRKATSVGPDYAFGWENAGGFQKVFEDAGGQVLQKIWFPFNVNDFSPYIAQISDDANTVFAMLGGKQAMVLLKQHMEYGLKEKVPIIGVMQITDESILPTMGDEALGVITAGIYSAALDTPVNRDFVRKYKARFGKLPSAFSEFSYNFMQMIDVAMTSLKGDISDPEKILNALKAARYEAPRGPMRIDAYGNPTQNIYIRKCERVQGEFQNTVIYTYPEVSQFWKYSPEEFLKQPVYSRDYPPLKR